MSVVLINAVLWPLAILVTVPLLLHLFARSKPPAYLFSSVEFIRRIVRTTLRIRRPQDWLLLVLRTLVFAAILLLFLQPLLFTRGRLAGAFERKNVVVIVDATASMGCAEGAQTRFAAACAEASEILAGLSSRDAANVIWLDAAPNAVFPELGVNLAFLQAALRREAVTAEAGDIEAALRLAARLLEGQEGRREIVVISDFQRTAWKNPDFGICPPGLQRVCVKVGAAEAPNAAVTDILFTPPRPLVGEEVSIACEVQNYSPQPRRTTLYLSADESRRSQDLMVPPWSKGVAVFKHTFKREAAFPISASLTEEGLPVDDERWAVLPVCAFLRVGLYAADRPLADTWRRALDAVGWARVETLAGSDLPPEAAFDAVLLAGWDGAGADAIRARLATGATVVWSPAPATPAARLQDLAGAASAAGAEALRWEPAGPERRLRIVRPDDPVFRLFASGEHGDPSRGVFRARMRIPAGALAQSDSLLAYDDGVPALARFRRGGTLFVWNLPTAPEFSTWAAQTAFLPFFAELLLTSRPLDGSARDLTGNVAGETVTWRPERALSAADVALRDRAGSALPVQELRSDGGTWFASVSPPPPGLYEWQHRGQTLSHGVVNVPVVESDLRCLGLDEVEKAGATAFGGGVRVRQLRDGVKLWPYLLAAALALALAEGAVQMWAERR